MCIMFTENGHSIDALNNITKEYLGNMNNQKFMSRNQEHQNIVNLPWVRKILKLYLHRERTKARILLIKTLHKFRAIKC